MSKLKKSLFAKLIASVLLVITMAACAAGVGGTLYMVNRYDVLDNDYLNSYACRQTQYQKIYNVRDYYKLSQQLAQGEELSYGDLANLEALERQLGITESSNLVWSLYDDSGKLLASNLAAGEDLKELIAPQEMNRLDESIYSEEGQKETVWHISFGVRSGLPYTDEFSQENQLFLRLKKLFMPIIVATILSGLVTIVLFCFLIAAAGHKANAEKPVINSFDKIWLEPLLVIAVLLFAAVFSYYDFLPLLFFLIITVIYMLILVLSVVRRAKTGNLYRTTFLYLFLRLIITMVKHTAITLRVSLVVCIYLIVQLLTIFGLWQGSFFSAILWFFSNLAVLTLGILAAIQYDRIKKATDRMAAGELGRVVDVSSVSLFAKIARNLNSTGSALNTAVEKATSSERMKTELITNVSHDIKTPLTSIISYVDLLKTTDIQDPKALEYIDVLERKSKRLGQLMADLVEASKVTSGNIAVNMEMLNLGELVKQAGGEFESRLEERGITLMCHLPEQPVMVYADGRHMWRVLDNIFGNTVKYAMDGTRVYVDLAELSGEVILSVKNISRDPLNIEPEELTERFVRGDQSRNTEGSGLGLSIARSLMELQGGTMNIQIDGDLFKVVLGLKKTVGPGPEYPSYPQI